MKYSERKFSQRILPLKKYLRKQNQNQSNPYKFVRQSHFKQLQGKRTFFWFLTEHLTLSLPVTCILAVIYCVGHNTNLHLNGNISKTVSVNTVRF